MKKETYKRFAEAHAPRSPILKNCLMAFVVGGSICALGQGLRDLYGGLLHLSETDAGTLTSVTLILLAVILTGLMELTNGIFAAQSLPRQMQFVLCSLFCSFGGVSVLLQIAGLSRGLGMGQCIAQKALHGLLTSLLSLLYLGAGAWSLLLIPAVLFAKIAVEIPKTMVYNVRRKEGI